MKIALIGQRGVGKSTLARQFKKTHPSFNVLDLDELIKEKEERSILDIFKKDGESTFRELEKKHALDIFQKSPEKTILVLGAGFQEDIPSEWKVIWVSRESDVLKRLFQNRPRLNQKISPAQEYSEKVQERSLQFQARYDEKIDLPEGNFTATQTHFNKQVLNFEIPPNSVICLRKEHLHRKRLEGIAEAIKSSPNSFVEFRDDLLDESDYQKICKYLETSQVLHSQRKERSFLEKIKDTFSDVALELGSPKQKPTIISSHSKKLINQEELINSFQSSQAQFLKVSWVYDSYSELIRSFLYFKKILGSQLLFFPRSTQLDLRGFRCISDNHFDFIRYGHTSSAQEQITLFQKEQLNIYNKNKKFAAIIGSQTQYSFSPAFHAEFFNQRKTAFFNFNIQKEDMSLELWNFLKLKGLVFSAITSPFKKYFSNAPKNTFIKSQFSNFDLPALKAFYEKHFSQKNPEVSIYGNGAMTECLKSFLPNYSIYSSRTAEIIEQKRPRHGEKKLLIWATSPTAKILEEIKTLNADEIWDLNYREDSRAKELVTKEKQVYYSGLEFFELQAKMQQEAY